MKAEAQMRCREWISLFGKNKLQLLQDSCATLFNISLGFVSLDGEPITVWSNSLLVCEKIESGNTESCMRERQRILKYVCEKHKSIKSTCYMGIVNFACPVLYCGELVAVCLGGGIAVDDGPGREQSMLRDIPKIAKEKLDEIINLIDCVVNILSPIENVEEKENGGQQEKSPATNDLLLLKNKLTMRELEVVRFINYGLSNKEISMKLNISEKTVKTHMSNILRKLKLKDRLEVILYCKNCIS